MNLSNGTYLFSGGQHKTGRDAGAWLSHTIASLQHLRVYWDNRRTRARELGDLYRFSDRELWDIGLIRADIMAIERGTYRRD